MSQPTPQQLTDALTANGWTHRSSDSYWYPGNGDHDLDRRWLAVRTTGANSADVAHALADLARAAEAGRRATAVLASLGGQQPDAPDITDALFPLLQQVRDHDSLDITDEEILEGHHRIEWYAWIAAQAYWLGAASRDTVKSSTDEEPSDASSDPARDPGADSGPTPRAQSEAERTFEQVQQAAGHALDEWRKAASEASNLRERVATVEAERDLALPFLFVGALAEHHRKCGEASQWDIRRCEHADCLERAHLLEAYGLIPQEWDTYPIPGPAQDVYNNLIAAQPGEVFSFEQATGRRVLVMVSVVQPFVEIPAPLEATPAIAAHAAVRAQERTALQLPVPAEPHHAHLNCRGCRHLVNQHHPWGGTLNPSGCQHPGCSCSLTPEQLLGPAEVKPEADR